MRDYLIRNVLFAFVVTKTVVSYFKFVNIVAIQYGDEIILKEKKIKKCPCENNKIERGLMTCPRCGQKRVIGTCPNCLEPLPASLSYVSLYGVRFCSNECLEAWRNQAKKMMELGI